MSERISHVQVFEKIVNDPRFRRELLWLRAHEKDDRESVRSLERVDPGVRGRMHEFAHTIGADLSFPITDRRARTDLFARLWHERYDAIEREVLARRG